MKPWGIVRASVAVLAGAGLVWGATEATGTADTTRPADVRAASGDTTSGQVTQASLTCAGADVDGSIQVASIPQAWAPKASAGGSVRVQGTAAGDLALQHGATAGAKLPSATTGRVVATGGLAAGLVAGQLHVDSRSVSRGLTLSACGTPVRSGWFFGGGPQQGRVARLTLVNPAATPSTVDVDVVGSHGVDKSASVAGTVLAPGQRTVLTLGDFGSDLEAAAVHVTASGAGVVTALTDAWMTGETPVGESTSGQPVVPANDLMIPGVRATAAAPTLRVAVPGQEQAIVRVRAISTSGAVVADKVETVDGGGSAALTLNGLAAGSYAVRVTADVPVAAAVVSRTGVSGTTDLSWVVPAPALRGPAGLALPAGVPDVSTQLMLTAPRTAAAEVRTTSASGRSTTRTVAVRAGHPVALSIDDVRAVWVRPVGKNPVHAGVAISGHDSSGPLLATAPVLPVTLHQATARLIPGRG